MDNERINKLLALREKLDNDSSIKQSTVEERRATIIKVFKRNNYRDPTEEEINKDMDYLNTCMHRLKTGG